MDEIIMKRKYVLLIVALLIVGSAVMYGVYQYLKVAYIEGPMVELEDGLVIYRWNLEEKILVLDKFKRVKSKIKSEETRHLVDLLLRCGPASSFAKYPEKPEMHISKEELISEEIKREKEAFERSKKYYEQGMMNEELYEGEKITHEKAMQKLREDLSEKDLKRLRSQKRGQLYMETMWAGEVDKFLMKFYEVDNPDSAALRMLKEEISKENVIIYDEEIKKEIYELVGLQE
jgi:hypothetical protein